MSENELRIFNPWWHNESSIRQDPEILAWNASAIKFEPALRHEIEYDFEPDNVVVYTLRGPRLVGKTTMVKLQIKNFLENGVPPWNIFYYTLDVENIKEDVVNIIRTYMNMVPGNIDGRRYLFLDEITSVRDWEKAIKYLRAANLLHNCTILATGSQAINIQKAVESLPNRRGKVKDYHDKVLLPMKFSEYVSVRSTMPDMMDKITLSAQRKSDIFSGLLRQEIDPAVWEIKAFHNTLDHLLKEYMLTGGIPAVVDEKMTTGMISESLYGDHMSGIKGEWGVMLKNVSMLNNFSKAVIKNQTKHVSWSGLSRDAVLGNLKTAMDYADVLNDVFVMSTVYQYHLETGLPFIKKNFKIYFQDPFFLHVFNSWNDPGSSFETSLKYVEKKENQGKLVEGIVADHLVRWAFIHGKKRTFNRLGHVLYWKDGKNREVDFVLRHGNDVIPIEVKFKNTINHRELGGMTGFIDRVRCSGGIVLSESELCAKKDYVVIPAYVFLMLV